MSQPALPVAGDNAVNRRELLLLGALLLLALLIRLAVIQQMSGLRPVSDELAYLKMAHHLVEGTTVSDVSGLAAFYNIGYPLFVLAPLEMLFGPSLQAVRVANAVLSVLTCLMCWQLARLAGAGRPGRLLAAAAWALYLPASVYSAYILKEGLMGLLITTWLCLGLHLAAGGRWRSAALAGLLCGVLALVGNAGLAVLPAVLWGLWAGRRSWQDLTLKLAAFGVTAALVATPWLLRNERVLGHAVLNTNGGFNLYLGNNPAATGMFVSVADTPMAKQWYDTLKTSEFDASAGLKQAAVAWIQAHPTEFAGLAIKKLGLFWMPPLHAGEGPSSASERAARGIWAAEYLVLLTLALGSLFLKWRGLADARIPLVASLALYSGVHMLFYVIFRYRESIMPLVCVLAALATGQIWQWWRARRATT